MLSLYRQPPSQFRDLIDDWDGYGAKKTTEAAIAAAETTWFVPTCDGGIQIEWSLGGIGVELDITPEGTIDCIFVYNTSDVKHSVLVEIEDQRPRVYQS